LTGGQFDGGTKISSKIFFLFLPCTQIKDRQTYDEIINFINARHFKQDDPDAQAIRKERFVINLKIITGLWTFGSFTLLGYFLLSPLTYTQKLYVFEEGQMYLYWLMVGLMYVMFASSGFLAMVVVFLLYSLINFVSVEFKVLGNSFKKILTERSGDLNEEETSKVLTELKSHVEHFDKLLQ
jgi:hypothetical protein